MTFSWVCVKCPKPPLHQPPTHHTWDSLVSSATALQLGSDERVNERICYTNHPPSTSVSVCLHVCQHLH